MKGEKREEERRGKRRDMIGTRGYRTQPGSMELRVKEIYGEGYCDCSG